MTKKITISVPDDLYAKMDKWKKSFNFSGVFQDAIRERIQRKEDFQKRLESGFDREATIRRLRREKLELEGDYFSMGKEAGIEWAKSAHYGDLQFALGWDPNPGEDPRRLGRKGMEHLEEYFSDMIENDELMAFEDNRHLTNQYLERFLKGWKEGVEVFWNDIKDLV
jgi:predicted CopG family antitoxin